MYPHALDRPGRGLPPALALARHGPGPHAARPRPAAHRGRRARRTDPHRPGLRIERGTTNYVTNPSFEVGLGGWSVVGSPTVTRETAGGAAFGDAYSRVGRRQPVTFALREFDPAGATGTAILDEVLALSEGGFTEVTRVPAEPPFDVGSFSKPSGTLKLVPGQSKALPEGWYSTTGTTTALGVRTLADGRIMLAILEAPASAIQTAIEVLDTVKVVE